VGQAEEAKGQEEALMDLGLAGKLAVVTGASRGLGRAIAQALAAEGARVVACARGAEPLAAAVSELPGGPHLAVAADVTTASGVETLIAAAEGAGGVDVLVNNVGGSGARHFDQADEADFLSTFERNFWPCLRVSRRALPSMRARGGGAIVIVSSVWGREAGGAPAYNAAKAAEISLAKAMARDLAKDGIRVNSVAPGSILFPGGGWDRRRQADPAAFEDFVRRDFPFARLGRPEEVGAAVAFLCSPRASWISGACLPVDGAQGKAF
jgi:3-oxoacyl-[acyl-carrier protein] reductase